VRTVCASGDGDYLLVLKLSEVYFNAPNMKVIVSEKPLVQNKNFIWKVNIKI
jgi:hypothetical protein